MANINLYKYISRNVRKSLMVSALFFVLSLLFSFITNILNPFDKYCNELQSLINSQSERIQNDEFTTTLASTTIANSSLKQLDELQKKDIIYQVYRDNNIEFWSDKSYAFDNSILQLLGETQKLYLFNNRPLVLTSVKKNDRLVVSIIDVEKFLNEKFSKEYKFLKRDSEDKKYSILNFPSKDNFEVETKSGDFLFSVQELNYYNDLQILIGLFLILVCGAFLIRALNYICYNIAKEHRVFGSLLFCVSMMSIYSIMHFFKFPHKLYTLKLFNPTLFSSHLFSSLGDLILFLMLIQFSIVFTRRRKPWANIGRHNPVFSFIVHTVTLLALLFISFYIVIIFEQLILESNIWFDLKYFPKIDIYSFIGLSAMMISLINYYLLARVLLKTINQFHLPFKKGVLSFVLLFSVSFALIFFTDICEAKKVLLVVIPLFLILFYNNYFNISKNSKYSILVFLFIASAISTYLLHTYNAEKEEIIDSYKIQNIGFGVDTSEYNNIEDILKGKKENGDRFNIVKIDEFDYSQDLASWNGDIKKIVDKGKFVLFFLKKNNTKFYLSKYDNSYYVIKPYYTKNLKIDDIVMSELDRTIYGIFYNDSLFQYQGDFTLKSSYHLKDELSKKKFESIYNDNKSIKIIIENENLLTYSILVLFSYIFCFNLLLIALFQFLSVLLSYDLKYNLEFQSLKMKILIFISLFVLFIFVLIGYVSYKNLTSSIQENARKEIQNNIDISQKSATYISTNKEEAEEVYSKMIKLYNYDLKVYDHLGKLYSKYSTNANNPSIKEMIYPNNIFELNKGIDIVTYRVKGKQWYSFIDKKTSNIISIANNESYITSRNTSKFFVSFINLYVFLFFLTMLIFYWISTLIINPINKLSDSINKLNISKKNEYIFYNQNDEIGTLVERYNKMVDEIEVSTKKLALQERDIAWNEMARQVAHEIKNPLTPMKLKIQSFQMRLKSGKEDLSLEANKLSEVLIEQIDQLEYIANTFRTFSEIGKFENETIDWIDIIENCITLYDIEGIEFNFENNLSTAEIVFEHNQMISCLNNIFKNAIQSYGDKQNIRIDVKLEQISSDYVLTVRDYGKGISVDVRDKIFQPNFTTKNSGTGLGLAITQKIINVYNGEIRFESVENEGTTFYISIPKKI